MPESFTGRSRAMCKRLLSAQFIVMIVWMTAGCATPTPHLPAVPIPANLTQPCPDLTPMAGKTGADVLRKIVEISQAYYECADAHAALIEAVR